jgi:hypothetical protein
MKSATQGTIIRVNVAGIKNIFIVCLANSSLKFNRGYLKIVIKNSFISFQEAVSAAALYPTGNAGNF